MGNALFLSIVGSVMAIPVCALAANIAECLWAIREERKNERR